jgi:hypothetical protein
VGIATTRIVPFIFCSPVLGRGFEQPDNAIFHFRERAFYPATDVKLFPLLFRFFGGSLCSMPVRELR